MVVGCFEGGASVLSSKSSEWESYADPRMDRKVIPSKNPRNPVRGKVMQTPEWIEKSSLLKILQIQ